MTDVARSGEEDAMCDPTGALSSNKFYGPFTYAL